MRGPVVHPNYEALARRFQRFAEAECRGSSPLYEHLAAAIATDDKMLVLATHAAQGQTVDGSNGSTAAEEEMASAPPKKVDAFSADGVGNQMQTIGPCN